MNAVDKLLLNELYEEDMADILHLEEDTELIDGFIPPNYEETLQEESSSIDNSYIPPIDDLF